MKIKFRILSQVIEKAIKSFPAIVVTGPRQSGKTTLLKSLLSQTHRYLNLEDPDTRMRAKDDPRTFLFQYQKPVIIDEIQYVPELLSYIKTMIDMQRRPGYWILTGSQNFTLMRGVSESLAGRAAVLSLLPFTFAESLGFGKNSYETGVLFKKASLLKRHAGMQDILAKLILRGSYPEVVSKRSINVRLWCGSYISTYLERDIRNLSQVGDLSQFERFLRLCAVRTGQILNISELAKEIGVSVPTAKRWLSLLETGYQVLLLYPYYQNLGKRLVKSPKLYFNDTALVCYLLGIHDSDALINSPYFPHLFETFIVTDFWKRFFHFGDLPRIYYLKTRDGLEIDLVIEMNQKLYSFEIKATATITSKHANGLLRVQRDFKNKVGATQIISFAEHNLLASKGITNLNWYTLLSS